MYLYFVSVICYNCCAFARKKNKHAFNDLFLRTNSVSWYQTGKTILDFNEARDDGVAVASAEPYANHLHLAADRRLCQHLITQFFMDQLLLLTSSQQCQGTEGIRMLTVVGSLANGSSLKDVDVAPQQIAAIIYPQHSAAGCKYKLKVNLCMHTCHTQYITEQFW